MQVEQFLKGSPFHDLAAQIIYILFPLYTFKNVPAKLNTTIPNKIEMFFLLRRI